MSSIGSGYGGVPQVNPYAGNARGGGDTDASRVGAVDRATDSDHEQFSENLAGANQSERSGDRDADGQTSGRTVRRKAETDDGESAQGGPGGGTARRTPVDDHRGNLIDFEA